MQDASLPASAPPAPQPEAGTDDNEPLRLVQPANPTLALGLAVSFLMNMPAFAARPFGDWSRVLVGQINRRHYHFVVDRTNRIVGFAGWAETTKDVAEAWVEGRANFSDREASGGNCLVFNAWAATSSRVNRFLLEAARETGIGKDTAYWKRFYRDGTIRPVRLKVNDFVAGHASRSRALRAGG